MSPYDSRPRIGIVAVTDRAQWSFWDQRASLVPRSYIDALVAEGGVPLLLPEEPWTTMDPEPLVSVLHGLLLVGGHDVDPRTYGEDPTPATETTTPERDAFERALLSVGLARSLPILGICRGMQMLNVALGGTLVQHLPGAARLHRRVLGSFEGAEHLVDLEPGSQAAAAAGEVRHLVRSHHHQAVKDLGRGLTVTGRASADGLIEAIEHADLPFVLGVQWHPEADERSRVIGALVHASRRRHAETELEGASTT